MKHVISIHLMLLMTLLLLALCISFNDARGGRGRGGSFGGIFGGWRKYKKTSSSTSSRRTVNGSPMQTEMQKPISGNGNAGRSAFGSSMTGNGKTASVSNKPKTADYPKQKMPDGYSSNGYGYNGAQLPAGGAYYANAAAMPAGAIYYAQPPMRSGTGDFLFGMMAGHMVSNMLFPHHHHITHVFHQNAANQPAAAASNADNKVVIIENGMNQTQQNYWPMESHVPLAPFNESITSTQAMQPANEPFFNGPPPPPSAASSSTSSADINAPASQESLQNFAQQQQTQSATTGIICVPVMLNETDPTDATKIKTVEKTICFPAPAPRAPVTTTATTKQSDSDANCVPVVRTVTEVDPFDDTKTILVQKTECHATTTEELAEVAGDIGATETLLKKKQDNDSQEDSKEKGQFNKLFRKGHFY